MHPLKYHSIRKALVSIKAEEIFPSYSKIKTRSQVSPFFQRKDNPISLGDFFVGFFLWLVLVLLVFWGFLFLFWDFFCTLLCQWLIVRKRETTSVFGHFPYGFREAAVCVMGVTVDLY